MKPWYLFLEAFTLGINRPLRRLWIKSLLSILSLTVHDVISADILLFLRWI